jgi:hypothetical protein
MTESAKVPSYAVALVVLGGAIWVLAQRCTAPRSSPARRAVPWSWPPGSTRPAIRPPPSAPWPGPTSTPNLYVATTGIQRHPSPEALRGYTSAMVGQVRVPRAIDASFGLITNAPSFGGT